MYLGRGSDLTNLHSQQLAHENPNSYIANNPLSHEKLALVRSNHGAIPAHPRMLVFTKSLPHIMQNSNARLDSCHVILLRAGAVAVDTVALLSKEVPVGVHLPKIVVSREQDQAVARNSRLEAGDGGLLVTQAWDGETIGSTSRGPARLGDHDLLARAGSCDVLDSLCEPCTCTRCEDAGVEECVGIGGRVVRGLAERTVDLVLGDHCVESVNVDDWAGVASWLENTLGGVDSSDELRSRGGTLVQKLVTSVDRVDARPAVADSRDKSVGVSADRVDVEQTGEDLLVGA